MKFGGEFRTTPVCNELPEVDIDYLVHLLKNVSWQVGDETKARLHAAIEKRKIRDLEQDGRISFRDTPVFGRFYVYLWFDSRGELFYVGKGSGNRAESVVGRSDDFKAKAAGGYYKILADEMNEGYALDLEKVLLLECALQERRLVNREYGDAVDAIRYCSGDREGLLYYWDHLGVISRFSELTGIPVFYDARGGVRDATDDRHIWWEPHEDVKTNKPEALDEIKRDETRKRKRRESYRVRREKLARKTAV